LHLVTFLLVHPEAIAFGVGLCFTADFLFIFLVGLEAIACGANLCFTADVSYIQY